MAIPLNLHSQALNCVYSLYLLRPAQPVNELVSPYFKGLKVEIIIDPRLYDSRKMVMLIGP